MHSTVDSTPILWIILLPSSCTAGTCGSILLTILLPIYISFYFHSTDHSTDHSTQNLLMIYLHATQMTNAKFHTTQCLRHSNCYSSWGVIENRHSYGMGVWALGFVFK